MIVRRAYTARRRGHVIRVPAARIRDMGARGKWTAKHGPGIGSLKTGKLERFGYDVRKGAPVRHAAIRKAVKSYGPLSTFRKLQAIGTYTKRTSKSKSKHFLSDRNWVKRKFM